MSEPHLYGIDLGVRPTAGVRDALDALQGTEFGAYYDEPPTVTIGLVYWDTLTNLITVSGLAVGIHEARALELFASTVGGTLLPLHRLDVERVVMHRKPDAFATARLHMHIERRRLAAERKP